MKLAQFFSAIAPFLEGKQSHAEAAQMLFGPDRAAGGGESRPGDASGIDARRLALYGRFCRIHRFDALGTTYEQMQAAVIRARGDAVWEQLVEDYFRAHPMHHSELNENGSELPAFLKREHVQRELPLWIAELADLEWWTFRTRVAPDDAQDQHPDDGPLRLGATVDLRPYAHDLPAWLEERESQEAEGESRSEPGKPFDEQSANREPEARACIVIFWRDRELDTRFAEGYPLELAILHAIVEGRPLLSARERTGDDAAALEETVADLLAAGVLLGKRA